MANSRPIILSAVSFAVALLLVSAYTNMRESEVTKTFGEKVVVVVAKESIPEYGLIRLSQLGTSSVYKKFVQPQTILVDSEDESALAKATESIVGKSAYMNIYAGEQVTLTKLVHQDGKPLLDRQIEKNSRAITFEISPHTGVGRLIRPGNRVDILAPAQFKVGDETQIEIKTVFQNVLVVATGKAILNGVPTRVNRAVLSSLEMEFEAQRRKDLYQTSPDPSTTSRPDDNYNTVTVQLSAIDAEKMILLQSEIGDRKLYLTLRNNADQGVAKLDTTILDQILGPESELGRSKVKPVELPPVEPRFYDNKGGTLTPVY
ncbi:MAG: Flp pilus assembly protein CpaB [Proteobacteria bacterium]|nr:Flp pilus assembly protein CpaB [Pseudomonadota bacterium]NDC23391.1 Flp pilus assembly protein CpaB [Pseudomonadota bacterium]NDD04863.1 Flp pilus assembly protein CpaB [Pseudomonadota bacterium]NDG27218.1 Flp pilus assembly protein CpaB [Pseudomonadota bacterium]